MSAYELYAAEKLELDGLVESGYQIRSVQEGLDGADVRLVHPGLPEGEASLRLLTADARKYLTVLLLRERRP
ncbi:hypothetical protein OIN60_21455 [Paenibacillus sp. P96]|uniref:Uncharacterized protein n=1 Tax=Paenibacillus zeirhizosphaerae TaxID=2987519 RepID=A0ABT9FX30_9BACL|nr:hypothetical protein [Paenibacillus sp. P96]MDP4099286.1 hypothetical protein [Paenibacillus sp. P96]